MVQTLKSRSGMSIVEICVTLLIIGVTTLIITAFTRSTFGMTRDARGRDAAFMSADDKITELSTQPYADATGSDLDTIDNIICARSWQIDNVDYIRRIIVTVTYTSLKGTSETITLAGALP